jgi:hypothetical protein
MRANQNRHLYFLAAREIEKSLADTRTRLNGTRASEAAGSSVVGVGALTRPLRHREKRNGLRRRISHSRRGAPTKLALLAL